MRISRSDLARLLRPAPLKGTAALLCFFVAIALPTALRAAVNGEVTGCEFTPYLPSVFLCAILLSPRQASAVALISVLIMGDLYHGTHHFMLPCFTAAASIFLFSSAIMIGSAMLFRRLIAGPNEGNAKGGGLVFSLEKGEVWASWYGQNAPVLLGSQRKVAEMMEDFLAQVELGKRLNVEIIRNRSQLGQ
jgi:hypothetical protein